MRLIRYIAYLLLLVLSFTAALPFFVPYDLLLPRLVERYGPGDLGLSIGETSFSPPRTWRLENISLGRPLGEGKRITFEIESLDLTPAFSTLIGSPSARFSALFAGGNLSGEIRDGGLRFTGGNIDLSRCAFLESITGWGLDGGVDLSGEIEWDEVSPFPGGGDISLSGSDIRLAGARFQGIDLPPLSLQTARGEISIDDARLNFTDFRGEGGNIDLSSLEGSVLLSRPLSASALDLTIRLRPSPAFNTELGAAGSFITVMADDAGILTVRTEGTLGEPNPHF